MWVGCTLLLQITSHPKGKTELVSDQRLGDLLLLTRVPASVLQLLGDPSLGRQELRALDGSGWQSCEPRSGSS